MKCDRDWYAPYEIRFNQCQIMWVLSVLDLLKQGTWPPGDPNDIYTQQCIQSGGYFEAAILVVAEVEIRLERTGDDGFIVRDRFYKEEQTWTLSRKYHLPEEEIKLRIRRALRYMSGDARKSMSYDAWIKNSWSESKKARSRNDPALATK